MSTRNSRLLAPALALGLLASVGTASLASAQQGPVTVQIGAGREESSATGTVTLTAVGNQTRVEVNVAGTNANMPGHIHADVCPGAGAVAFPLQNVMNGRSTTTLDAPLSDVLARGKSINFHKSAQEVQVYTGCGNITVAGAQTGGAATSQPAAAQPAALPRTGDLGSAAPLLGAASAGLLGLGYALRRRARR